MGYSGARLAPLFDDHLSTAAAVKLAESGADLILKETKQNTAIDDSPFPSRAPGTARASWRKKHLSVSKHGAATVYDTGVESEDKVTLYLEYGTGLYGPEHHAYTILPKNPGGMLRFYSRKSGQWVVTRKVIHPGIPPQRPLATGMALAEARMEMHVRPIMEAWVRAAEAHAKLKR